jgi:hypothetical protein
MIVVAGVIRIVLPRVTSVGRGHDLFRIDCHGDRRQHRSGAGFRSFKGYRQ